jgi:riboflavin kinase/FMN adenylyltransferase
MRIVHDLAELERAEPTVLTIGAFDGVHRGHQFLIRQVVARARHLGARSMVLTFDPRPQVVLRPGSVQLTDGPAKARIMAALGVDVLTVLPFSRALSEMPAGQFLVSILDHVNLIEVWVGADFAFGHNREGNVDFLIRTGQHSGFAVHVVARQALDREPISSTRARELVGGGDVAAAARVLGHFPSVGGVVTRGAGRGVTLGYPTANLEVPQTQLIPTTGIYAGYLRVDGERMPAAISVGRNLTFGGGDVVVEAYVLDFEGDLRGRSVHLDFVARLRDELRFDGADELVAQMDRDVEETRVLLARAEEPGELLLQP